MSGMAREKTFVRCFAALWTYVGLPGLRDGLRRATARRRILEYGRNTGARGGQRRRLLRIMPATPAKGGAKGAAGAGVLVAAVWGARRRMSAKWGGRRQRGHGALHGRLWLRLEALLGGGGWG